MAHRPKNGKAYAKILAQHESFLATQEELAITAVALSADGLLCALATGCEVRVISTARPYGGAVASCTVPDAVTTVQLVQYMWGRRGGVCTAI